MQDRVSRWHYLLAAIALVGMVSFVKIVLPLKAKRKVGGFTAAEIAVKSETICRACTPIAIPINIYPEARELWKSGTLVGDLWTVDCTAFGGKDVAFMVWNAQTGDLRFVSVLWRRRIRNAPLTRKSAIREGANWVRRLGLSSVGERWRLGEEVVEGPTSWQISYCSVDRKIIVAIDRRSGDLITAARIPVQRTRYRS